MSLIQVKNLTFAYDGSYDAVFEKISFQIDTDWKIGCVGRNGRGKTTLLRLLMGEFSYQGSISGSVSFDYFPYPVQDTAMDTMAVLETITDAPIWQVQRELSCLEVDEGVLYRPYGTLSSGEQTKVLLAALFLNEGRFLLIDEPTNHLDMEARQTLGKYLSRKKGFMLVSHDRTLLDLCTDHILSIGKEHIEVQRGNFSTWWENKERREQFEFSENEKLQGQIRELSAAARQTAQWADKVEKSKYHSRTSGLRPDRGYIGHKAAKMMQRSKAAERRMEKAIEEKSRLLKNIDTAEDLKLFSLRHHRDPLAQILDLSIQYGDLVVCSGVRFAIHRGDRIALVGKNGSGKSSILKLLLGLKIPHTGEVHIESGLQISYVPQDTSALSGDMKSFAAEHHLDEALFRAILRKLDFSRSHFDQDLQLLSGGQKKKVLIAKSLCEKAHLYIWDEPLNYIDVPSRMQIEKLLLEYAPTLLFVEHDRTFVKKIATQEVLL